MSRISAPSIVRRTARADLVEAELPGGSGVDVEQVVDGIVDDFEDVGMPGR